MDLYEYQARQLLAEHGISQPRAVYASTAEEAGQAADVIGYPCMIKGQATIGHRGQAGAVKRAENHDQAVALAQAILPMNIDGHPVSGILVTEARNILHEYYLSISVDRASRDYDVLATASGGTEVETIAREHPESVRRLHIGPLEDFDRQAALTMAERIGFYHADLEQAAQILLGMWHTFQDSDATLVEINPLAKVGDPDDEATKHLDALDAKISLDGNAAFRHDGWKRFTDPAQVDPLEAKAKAAGLHYVHLDGQVGVIGNGAGLVMSSLDAVAGSGRRQGVPVGPANFLDIGGGASPEVMRTSLDVVLSDPKVRSVMVNVYGGITSCQQVAQGILVAVDAAGEQDQNDDRPIVVRFDGNEAAEGLDLLAKAQQPRLKVARTMEEAADQAVALAAQAGKETGR